MAARPRDDDIDRRLLDETLAHLARAGYAGLSLRQVAADAGSTRAALYRRFGSKAELVLAAVAGRMQAFTVVTDTGSLRGDLRAHASTLADRFARDGVAVIGALMSSDAAQDGVSADALATMARAEETVTATILDRAAVRGEIDPRGLTPTARQRVSSLLPALVHHRVATDPTPVTGDELDFFVDDVALPTLRALSGARPDTRKDQQHD